MIEVPLYMKTETITVVPCEDRVLDGPASGEKGRGKRAPRVGISSTVFGVRA